MKVVEYRRNLAFKQKHLEMVYILFEESSEQKNGQVKEFRTRKR